MNNLVKATKQLSRINFVVNTDALISVGNENEYGIFSGIEKLTKGASNILEETTAIGIFDSIRLNRLPFESIVDVKIPVPVGLKVPYIEMAYDLSDLIIELDKKSYFKNDIEKQVGYIKHVVAGKAHPLLSIDESVVKWTESGRRFFEKVIDRKSKRDIYTVGELFKDKGEILQSSKVLAKISISQRTINRLKNQIDEMSKLIDELVPLMEDEEIHLNKIEIEQISKTLKSVAVFATMVAKVNYMLYINSKLSENILSGFKMLEEDGKKSGRESDFDIVKTNNGLYILTLDFDEEMTIKELKLLAIACGNFVRGLRLVSKDNLYYLDSFKQNRYRVLAPKVESNGVRPYSKDVIKKIKAFKKLVEHVKGLMKDYEEEETIESFPFIVSHSWDLPVTTPSKGYKFENIKEVAEALEPLADEFDELKPMERFKDVVSKIKKGPDVVLKTKNKDHINLLYLCLNIKYLYDEYRIHIKNLDEMVYTITHALYEDNGR